MKVDQIYWVGQKAFIERGGEVLVLTDANGEGLDFPGGKIQEGEKDLAESLKREVREEVNLEIDVGKPFITWHNAFPAHHKYAGKKVYLVGFNCKYISGDVSLSDEHNKFRWVNKDNYMKVDDVTSYFEILDKYFKQS